MGNWLVANWGTIIISIILISIVAAIITNLRRKKKKGISSCGCNCSHCGGGCSCNQK